MNEPSATALLVEDEPQIRSLRARSALEDEGWQIFESATMQRLIDAHAPARPDRADLGLPDGDGIDFISDIRKRSAVPIIVLSARVNEQDKIRALDAGADDYLTQAIRCGELCVRATLRRQPAGPPTLMAWCSSATCVST